MNPSLVLVQPRKTCPYITERLLMGRKESNQTNKRMLLRISCYFILMSNFDALHPSKQFFSDVGTSSWIEPVLSRWDQCLAHILNRVLPSFDQNQNMQHSSTELPDLGPHHRDR